MSDVFAVVDDLPGTGFEKMGQQVEKGGFAGTVRANQGMDAPRLYFHIDVVDGGEAFEIFLQIPGFKNDRGRRCVLAHRLVVHGNTPLSVEVGYLCAVALLFLVIQVCSEKVADTAN